MGVKIRPPLSTITRLYICATCGANLILRAGRLGCRESAVHFGWIKRSTVERRYDRLHAIDRDVLMDRFFRENLEGWPQPERVGVEKAMEELFG